MVINVVAIDAVLLYFLFTGGFGTLRIKPSNTQQVNEASTVISGFDNCGSECQEYIDARIAQLPIKISTTPAPTQTQNNAIVPTRTKVKNISYVPIPGNGSTTNTEWTTLAGTDFYIKKSDYPGLTGIYMEANVKLSNGNGTAYFRLFDITHSVGVQGSEISTSSQTSTFVGTGMIYPWEGYNHYVIQAKTLTADIAVFENGRLKIITEN